MFALRFLFKVILRKRKSRKFEVAGALVSLIVAVASTYVLLAQDWTIPKCHDESGSLMVERPECQYP